MKLAIYDDHRLGLVDAQRGTITPLAGPPGRLGSSPLGAGWWVRLCRDIADGVEPPPAAGLKPLPLDSVRLRAPVLNPGKVIACASNYAAHVTEMREEVLPRAGVTDASWLLDFDVFLKAPSSIVGPSDRIVLPSSALEAGREVHHEGELAIVVGRGGRDIPEDEALDHVLGYVVSLDITVRGPGDRSRRKSHPTFTPLGPWLTTADEIRDWAELPIELAVNDQVKQQVRCREMLMPVPAIVSHASRAMGLQPGDVILTGAPPGVGPIEPGDVVRVSIGPLGTMTMPVVAEEPVPAGRNGRGAA
jgi:2-keto-4-pentenoate hydratase/2-oxohepta-3-ene-1,7-dioic acid hydratase in catechol pathway